MEQINAIGRRKTAVARVFVSEGKGNITVNNRPVDEYFTTKHHYNMVMQPFETIETASNFDYKVNLAGGGTKGQAEALRMAISRALIKIDPESRPALKQNGFLTRDSRKVERKKPGQPKARKQFQFSKR